MSTWFSTRSTALVLFTVVLTIWDRDTAHASELHSVFDDSCNRYTGVLVHVDANRVVIVDLHGKSGTVDRRAIAAIVVHRTLENPLTAIELGQPLRGHLRDVWVGDDAQPTFVGWAAAFFDDLFLFVDLEGQTHVLDPEEIRRIRPSSISGTRVVPRTQAPVSLGFPAEVVPCGTPGVPDGAVLPSRVIADRIKVGEYLTKLEDRYVDLEGFESRTRVYAQPFVFDLQSRVGLIYHQGMQIPLPFYFRWSNGRPYRFQSLTRVGNVVHDWLPSVEPMLSLGSDAKSHFFSATFVGNALALPAGTSPFAFQESEELAPSSPPRVESSYNYVLFMGLDFWRLSVAGGTSYLATRVEVSPADMESQPLRPRVVLATSASPTICLRYQDPRLRIRALYFRTRASGPFEEVIEDSFGEPEVTMDTYRLRSDAVRVGATWKPTPTVELSLDQIVRWGRYSDNYSGNNSGGDGAENVAATFRQLTTSGDVAIDFGRYVTVRAHAQLDIDTSEQIAPIRTEGPAKGTTVEPKFGGALEFVF